MLKHAHILFYSYQQYATCEAASILLWPIYFIYSPLGFRCIEGVRTKLTMAMSNMKLETVCPPKTQNIGL